MCPYSYYFLMRISQDKKQLRYHIVVYAEHNGIRKTARIFNLSKNTVKKWVRRFKEFSYDGLVDISKRPHYSPNATPEKQRKKLVELKNKYKRLGADTIKTIENISISSKTIRKIWRQEGVSSRKRRKKHITKQNLREIKKQWNLFQQIDEDTKSLIDIPEYWIQIKKHNLPTIQYTARDVTSGLTYFGLADELALTNSVIFAKYLNSQFLKYGVDLSQTIRQTDNGSEYIGSWQAKNPSDYTKTIESVKGQLHRTIPAGAYTFQSDVETMK